jgi:phosphate transport system protein
MTVTVRRTFEASIQALKDDVVELGDRVETALLVSVDALKERDLERSRRLIAQDRELDDMRYRIESDALTLIATQQPMAGDMRMIAAAIFIANELERIGDYAKGIARINLRIGPEPLMKPLIDIPRMAVIGQEMVHGSLDAFIQHDSALARAVIERDEEVDALYDQVYSEVLTLLFSNVRQIRQGNLLVMAAHNLERAADRATNICERVIYSVTGELLDTGWAENDVA